MKTCDCSVGKVPVRVVEVSVRKTGEVLPSVVVLQYSMCSVCNMPLAKGEAVQLDRDDCRAVMSAARHVWGKAEGEHQKAAEAMAGMKARMIRGRMMPCAVQSLSMAIYHMQGGVPTSAGTFDMIVEKITTGAMLFAGACDAGAAALELSRRKAMDEIYKSYRPESFGLAQLSGVVDCEGEPVHEEVDDAG